MKFIGSLYLQLLPALLVLMEHANLCLADFLFEIQVLSITTSNASDCGGDDSTPVCETYLSIFCLREGRNFTSNNTADCPLGTANRTYFFSYEIAPIRYIVSEQPWTVGYNNQF